ncbi:MULTISPECIES: ribonuclease HI family protein [Haloarcula]|uniref:ribonuclease HI family protein n=1 Tax=Haloarcula TaxID=2237 RepID=UPI000F8DDDB4|nr:MULTISPECIES: ribonuclease HI family protein [Haloarcula]NHX40419.1 ribonuclease HI family protein [Haloarcula sp. R1-2]
MTTPAVIHFDGGARPSNPGPAAIGYTIEAEDWSDEGSEHLGKATNNEAEYRALIRGLEVASKQGCTEVEARGDSQLVVRQVTGDWQTNEQHLRELRDRARELAEEFETFEIVWVDREENLRADELVDREFGH